MAAEPEQELLERRLLEDRFGVVLCKIPERDVPTPDYELVADGTRVAVVEVKTLQHRPRTPENGWRVEYLNEHS